VSHSLEYLKEIESRYNIGLYGEILTKRRKTMEKSEKAAVILIALALLIRVMNLSAMLGMGLSPVEWIAIILFAIGLATLVTSNTKQ